jgi:tRNA threonylcarbamoyladenosine modification (KEOPS) complex  Pcc1 subunit
MHPAGRKAQAVILTRGKTLKLMFQAKDTSTLRAVFSSYLRILAASLKVSSALIEMEGTKTRAIEKS